MLNIEIIKSLLFQINDWRVAAKANRTQFNITVRFFYF